MKSAQTIADGILNRYSLPRVEVTCDFVDKKIIDFKQSLSLKIGDVVNLYQPNQKLIYTDVIAEITYDPLEPQKNN